MKSTLSLLVTTIASTTLLIGQEPPMKRPEGDMPRQQMMEHLKLNDDQKNQIEKLHVDFQKQQIAQRSKLQTSRLELRQLMRAENSDKAAIEKKINEVSQFGAQMRVGRVNQMLSVRKILTAEQQKMLREGMKMRMQRGFMRPPQGKRFEGRMQRFGPDFRSRRPF